MAKDDKKTAQSTKDLNQQHEDALVAAQWAKAKSLGLTEGVHAESLNPDASAPEE